MKFIATIDKDRLNTIRVQNTFEDFGSDLLDISPQALVNTLCLGLAM